MKKIPVHIDIEYMYLDLSTDTIPCESANVNRPLASPSQTPQIPTTNPLPVSALCHKGPTKILQQHRSLCGEGDKMMM